MVRNGLVIAISVTTGVAAAGCGQVATSRPSGSDPSETFADAQPTDSQLADAADDVPVEAGPCDTATGGAVQTIATGTGVATSIIVIAGYVYWTAPFDTQSSGKPTTQSCEQCCSEPKWMSE